MTRDEIARARRLAVEQHNGRVLSRSERDLVNRAVDEMSPENFYMDGELFAN